MADQKIEPTEPKTEPKTETKTDAPARSKTVDRDGWKPKVGASCTAVYMLGGPSFVEAAGKITKLGDDLVASVEYRNRRGGVAMLEGVPYVAPGKLYDRACYTAPAG